MTYSCIDKPERWFQLPREHYDIFWNCQIIDNINDKINKKKKHHLSMLEAKI